MKNWLLKLNDNMLFDASYYALSHTTNSNLLVYKPSGKNSSTERMFPYNIKLLTGPFIFDHSHCSHSIKNKTSPSKQYQGSNYTITVDWLRTRRYSNYVLNSQRSSFSINLVIAITEPCRDTFL